MKRVGIARWAAVTVGLLSFALAGCQSTGTSESDSSAQTGSEFDQGAGDTRDSASRKPVALETVYFDFDRYNIRGDAGSVLQKNAAVIEENAGWGTITVEGNTDERGSEEYNLALGDRRASATRDYIVSLGIGANRVEIVSYGEERPAAMGQGEQNWSQNRRGEFVATSAGQTNE